MYNIIIIIEDRLSGKTLLNMRISFVIPEATNPPAGGEGCPESILINSCHLQPCFPSKATLLATVAQRYMLTRSLKTEVNPKQK